MAAAVVLPILTETTATTMTAPTAMHAETVLVAITLIAVTLVAITLIVTVLPGVLLRLTAAGYECRQAADILSAFVSALVRMIRLASCVSSWFGVARDNRATRRRLALTSLGEAIGR